MTHEFNLEESWEGDGTGGVMFQLPSGGFVFISRWTDRGIPNKATQDDWSDAKAIVAAIESAMENGTWQ